MIMTVSLEHTTAWDIASILADHVDRLPDTGDWPTESQLIRGVRSITEGIGRELYKRRRYRVRSNAPRDAVTRRFGIWDRQEEEWFRSPDFEYLTEATRYHKTIQIDV